MSDRFSAFCLALLLAAPLCILLDSELLESEVTNAREDALTLLSRDAIERHAEGLRQDTEILAAN